jgi:hypothetical protein
MENLRPVVFVAYLGRRKIRARRPIGNPEVQIREEL